MAVLKLIRGGAIGQILPLSGDRIVLGRHPTCQIVLDNVAVSRHHAQILESHGTYFLEDLRSRNGTQLNTESIRGRVELKDGDQIKLCDYVFQFLVSSTATTDLPRLAGGKIPLRSRTRETIDNISDPSVLADDHASSHVEGSSIISSLEPESVQTIRLHVRPEVKLRAILEIGQVLARVLQVDAVLPLILDGLFKIFPQAEWGFVFLKDPVTGRGSVRTSKSRRADEEDRFPFSQTIVDQAMNSGKAILSADALRDARFATSDSLQGLQIRSVMCSPMQDVSGQALGVIQICTRDLNQQFTSDDLELLASVSSQCARALEHATLHEQLLAQREMERELEFATQVQLGFLPSEAPQLPGYEFDDYYEPAHRVSGDYFDYIRLPNGNLAVTVGDVAGKGVPAALLMARLHASARYHLLSATSAAEALSSLNSEIATSGLGFRFITLVMAVINPKTNEVHIANAGHLPPLLRSRRGVIGPIGLKDSGMPLGVLLQQNYRETVLPLEPDDTLLFFTDGLTEAMNDAEQIYGQGRLLELLKTAPVPVEDLVPFVVDDVEHFVSERSQRDDLCIVAVRRME
ncbi:SpoIIE family protein phosphatase [bacterium]|nr:SpoIIE family protein phosphatase [bacterium]